MITLSWGLPRISLSAGGLCESSITRLTFLYKLLACFPYTSFSPQFSIWKVSRMFCFNSSVSVCVCVRESVCPMCVKSLCGCMWAHMPIGARGLCWVHSPQYALRWNLFPTTELTNQIDHLSSKLWGCSSLHYSLFPVISLLVFHIGTENFNPLLLLTDTLPTELSP